MNPFRYDYAIIGGDLRQAYLAAELAKDGFSVCCYALCCPARQLCPDDSSVCLPTLEAALANSKRIICPIPFSKDKLTLNQSLLKKNISVRQMLSLLSPGQHLFGGCIPKDFCQAASEKGIFVSDFMEDETLSYFNTIATAEGAICEAIKESPVNLCKSRCAVLGYGKCGQTLTDRLKRMFCHVTTAASPAKELAQAALVSDEVLELQSFLSDIKEYDFIFNTIPALILTKEVLLQAKSSVIILDIASAPGGIDFAAAKELSVNARSCPGLPGRYAPLSSAKAMKASLCAI